MKFLRVRPEARDKRVQGKGKRFPLYLVGRELITRKEAEREGILNQVLQYADEVEVKKHETYFCFGVRFQSSNK